MTDEYTPWVSPSDDDGRLEENEARLAELMDKQVALFIEMITFLREQIAIRVEWANRTCGVPEMRGWLVGESMRHQFTKRMAPTKLMNAVVSQVARDVADAIEGREHSPIEPFEVREIIVNAAGSDPQLN